MNFLIVVLGYVFCHGVTAFVVTPVQSSVFPEYTVFASLVYLPHGVRVLAIWAFGWRAIPALVVGLSVSAWLFTPSNELDILEPALLEGILVGALCAFLAFELVRRFGYDYYFGSSRNLSWRGMILIGAISSIINSVGQTLVFSGVVGLNELPALMIFYAVGDLVGLIICMVVLMFCFRWMRWLGLAKRH